MIGKALISGVGENQQLNQEKIFVERRKLRISTKFGSNLQDKLFSNLPESQQIPEKRKSYGMKKN